MLLQVDFRNSDAFFQMFASDLDMSYDDNMVINVRSEFEIEDMVSLPA